MTAPNHQPTHHQGPLPQAIQVAYDNYLGQRDIAVDIQADINGLDERIKSAEQELEQARRALEQLRGSHADLGREKTAAEDNAGLSWQMVEMGCAAHRINLPKVPPITQRPPKQAGPTPPQTVPDAGRSPLSGAGAGAGVEDTQGFVKITSEKPAL